MSSNFSLKACASAFRTHEAVIQRVGKGILGPPPPKTQSRNNKILINDFN